jgi:AcrR family transcriptional regulator
MTSAALPTGPDPTRERILDAADERFRQYGYGKTTMAEIAADVNMSAANLYRYFENKRDIGAGLALRCFAQKETLLAAVVQRADLDAAQKLEAYLLTLLRYTHAQCNDRPRINELVEDIATHRADIVERKLQGEHRVIAAILDEGRRTGEFAVDDLKTMAATVMNATLVFGMPMFMQAHPLERFETLARNTARLLVRGLASRAP